MKNSHSLNQQIKRVSQLATKLIALGITLSLAALAGAADFRADGGLTGLFEPTGDKGGLGGNQALACDIHRNHPAQFYLAGVYRDNTSVPVDSQLDYNEICNLNHYDETQRFSAHPTKGKRCKGTESKVGNWPWCVDRLDEPDLGYRYPLVDFYNNSPTQSSPDGLKGDWWSVCVSPDLSSIAADPEVKLCVAGQQEVGRCIAAAHYYEKLSGSGKRAGERPYSFVLSHKDCRPQATGAQSHEWVGYCAHDVVSSVDTCMRNCEMYLGELTYNGNDWDPIDPQLSQPVPADAAFHADAIVADHTLLTQCRSLCGPPYDEEFVCSEAKDVGDECEALGANPPESSYGIFDTHDAPQWVSDLSTNSRSVAEKNNHWHFVEYGRAWNPNKRVANWLRSYNVNRDKPTAPARHCKMLAEQYCADKADPTVCDDLMIEALPVDELTFDPRLPAQASGDGRYFCRIFYRGAALCPETCHISGGDADEPLGRNLCGVDLPSAFRDERSAYETGGPLEDAAMEAAIVNYMKDFECSGVAGRCVIKSCNEDFADTQACRSIGFMIPEKKNLPVQWSDSTIEKMALYTHSRFGELFPPSQVVESRWEIRDGAFNTSPLLYDGDLVASGNTYIPKTKETDSLLVINKVYRVKVFFTLISGVPYEDYVKLKYVPAP